MPGTVLWTAVGVKGMGEERWRSRFLEASSTSRRNEISTYILYNPTKSQNVIKATRGTWAKPHRNSKEAEISCVWENQEWPHGRG